MTDDRLESHVRIDVLLLIELMLLVVGNALVRL